MSNKMYDFLRVLTAVLPTLGTLYFAIAEIWGLPYGDAVVATCSAVSAFIATLTKIKSDEFFKDKTIVETEAKG